MKWIFRWGSVRNRFDSIESASRSGGRSANRDRRCSCGFDVANIKLPLEAAGLSAHVARMSERTDLFGRGSESAAAPALMASPGLGRGKAAPRDICSACRGNCDGRHVEPTTLQPKAKVQAAAAEAFRSLFRNRPARRRKALKPGRVFGKPEGAAQLLWRERLNAPNPHQFNSCTRQCIAE
jgi:hypothetical protein